MQKMQTFVTCLDINGTRFLEHKSIWAGEKEYHTGRGETWIQGPALPPLLISCRSKGSLLKMQLSPCHSAVWNAAVPSGQRPHVSLSQRVPARLPSSAAALCPRPLMTRTVCYRFWAFLQTQTLAFGISFPFPHSEPAPTFFPSGCSSFYALPFRWRLLLITNRSPCSGQHPQVTLMSSEHLSQRKWMMLFWWPLACKLQEGQRGVPPPSSVPANLARCSVHSESPGSSYRRAPWKSEHPPGPPLPHRECQLVYVSNFLTLRAPG